MAGWQPCWLDPLPLDPLPLEPLPLEPLPLEPLPLLDGGAGASFSQASKSVPQNAVLEQHELKADGQHEAPQLTGYPAGHPSVCPAGRFVEAGPTHCVPHALAIFIPGGQYEQTELGSRDPQYPISELPFNEQGHWPGPSHDPAPGPLGRF